MERVYIQCHATKKFVHDYDIRNWENGGIAGLVHGIRNWENGGIAGLVHGIRNWENGGIAGLVHGIRNWENEGIAGVSTRHTELGERRNSGG